MLAAFCVCVLMMRHPAALDMVWYAWYAWCQIIKPAALIEDCQF